MNFEQHMKIIKEHYGYTKEFLKPTMKKGEKVATEDTKPLRMVEPILLIAKLNEQELMFCITMKANCHGAMIRNLPLNPLTCLWHWLETLGLLRHKLSEYLKVVELVIVMVLSSVEDKQTFSTLSFMKNKLRNRLSNHLLLVIAMHAQEFYSLVDFSYNTTYNDWKMNL